VTELFYLNINLIPFAMDEALPEQLPLVMAAEHEYVALAYALGTTPLARFLVMSNGVRVGWRSNRHVYVSPAAYKVATGKYPRGYRP
jgi:hypothetical protein